MDGKVHGVSSDYGAQMGWIGCLIRLAFSMEVKGPYYELRQEVKFSRLISRLLKSFQVPHLHHQFLCHGPRLERDPIVQSGSG